MSGNRSAQSLCVLSVVLAFGFTVYAGVEARCEMLVGGYLGVPTTEKGVIAAANCAVEEEAKREDIPLQLIVIRSSERQVVAGMNYRFSLIVKRESKEQLA